MRQIIFVCILVGVMLAAACSPQVTPSPAPLPTATQPPASSPPQPTPTQPPPSILPTETGQPAVAKPYTNAAFGLAFQFPAAWFGPEEYVSDNTLRVEVGSDVVYPYGEPPDQPSSVTDSYNVVIQYTKDNQNTALHDAYQSLQGMQDGETLSGPRSLIIRVRELRLGRFSGYEYVFTLPDTAQTERVYGRQVILVDPQTSDQLTVMGQPNNVVVPEGAQWREVFQSIDEANLDAFHAILDSIQID